jgi:hypothetical protein
VCTAATSHFSTAGVHLQVGQLAHVTCGQVCKASSALQTAQYNSGSTSEYIYQCSNTPDGLGMLYRGPHWAAGSRAWRAHVAADTLGSLLQKRKTLLTCRGQCIEHANSHSCCTGPVLLNTSAELVPFLRAGSCSGTLSSGLLARPWVGRPPPGAILPE